MGQDDYDYGVEGIYFHDNNFLLTGLGRKRCQFLKKESIRKLMVDSSTELH